MNLYNSIKIERNSVSGIVTSNSQKFKITLFKRVEGKDSKLFSSEVDSYFEWYQ